MSPEWLDARIRCHTGGYSRSAAQLCLEIGDKVHQDKPMLAITGFRCKSEYNDETKMYDLYGKLNASPLDEAHLLLTSSRNHFSVFYAEVPPSFAFIAPIIDAQMEIFSKGVVGRLESSAVFVFSGNANVVLQIDAALNGSLLQRFGQLQNAIAVLFHAYGLEKLEMPTMHMQVHPPDAVLDLSEPLKGHEKDLLAAKASLMTQFHALKVGATAVAPMDVDG